MAFTALELESGGLSLMTVGPERSKPVAILHGSNDGVDPSPFSGVSWSPDGAWVYFAAFKNERKGIYRVRADGTGVRLIRGTAGGTNPVVSADGSKLAFTRERPPHGALADWQSVWVADADGGHPLRLTAWRRTVEYVPTSFAPDNSALAVTHTDLSKGMTKVMLIRPDRSRRIRRLARPASDAVFSPDGSRIAVVRHTLSSRGPRFAVDKDLYVINADGSGSTRLTRTPKVAETRPSWDPLGERLAFNAYRNSKDEIEAIIDELLPIGNSIVEVNADGSCRRRVLRLHRGIIRGVAWRPGADRAPGRIAC